MGYTTTFDGEFYFNKPVDEDLKNYINVFSRVRHMKRDVDTIKKIFPEWKSQCFNGYLGTEGQFFIGSQKNYGQNNDPSIISYNDPPGSCPELWCQWIINDQGNLAWDGGEKFYEYVAWLEYLIDNFFEPNGYVLNGNVSFEGEYSHDRGVIYCDDNCVKVQY